VLIIGESSVWGAGAGVEVVAGGAVVGGVVVGGVVLGGVVAGGAVVGVVAVEPTGVSVILGGLSGVVAFNGMINPFIEPSL